MFILASKKNRGWTFAEAHRTAQRLAEKPVDASFHRRLFQAGWGGGAMAYSAELREHLQVQQGQDLDELVGPPPPLQIRLKGNSLFCKTTLFIIVSLNH